MKHPFQSEHLEYRAVEETDNDFLHSISVDATAFANARTGLLHPVSLTHTKDHRVLITKCLLNVIICLKSPPQTRNENEDSPSTPLESPEPEPIGYILLHNSNTSVHHRNAGLSIELLNTYQGKGYGSEAIFWALNWAFQIAGLHRISISSFSWNTGAERLYERLGFVREGRKREVFWFDGGWGDLVEFAMLEGEWRAMGRVVKLLDK